jgi:hypothetical protein
LPGIESGKSLKSPDFSLEFPGIERCNFLVGETGTNDSGAPTRTRIQNWLNESEGKVIAMIVFPADCVCIQLHIGIALDIQVSESDVLNRKVLNNIVVDVYHMTVPLRRQTRLHGGVRECTHSITSVRSTSHLNLTYLRISIIPAIELSPFPPKMYFLQRR